MSKVELARVAGGTTSAVEVEGVAVDRGRLGRPREALLEERLPEDITFQ